MNTEILGCSFDSAEDQRKFADKFGFPFPLLPDTEKRIGTPYGACSSEKDEYARRIAYLIDEEGKVVEAHDSVNAKTYPQEQLERLVDG